MFIHLTYIYVYNLRSSYVKTSAIEDKQVSNAYDYLGVLVGLDYLKSILVFTAFDAPLRITMHDIWHVKVSN